MDKNRRALMSKALQMAVLSMAPLPLLSYEIEEPNLISDPFTLGVASGDPVQDGVILWTRLAPSPLDVKAMPDKAIPISWVLCKDEACKQTVQSGKTLAYSHNAHSVHVEVKNLQPNTTYYYYFTYQTYQSAVGKTKTLPIAGTPTNAFTFAVASCQSFTDGHYAAYKDMVNQQPDVIIHTGDYIYEQDWLGGVRNIPIVEAKDLDDYRQLYATYKQDKALQAAHACAPWLMIWDDHEVDNDWGGKFNQENMDEETFVKRKVAAFKAYFEHMPLRFAVKPKNNKVQLHRRAVIGDLIQFDLLDCRQYRDMPACEKYPPLFRSNKAICEEAMNSSRSMLGKGQEAWLMRGLGHYQCKWNAIIQTTMLAPFDNFAASRQRILDKMASIKLSNPLSFGGNIHAFYAGVVNKEALDSDSPALLTELVCGSISSGGGGDDRFEATNAQFSENKFAHYFENRVRGYLLCQLNHEKMIAKMQGVHNLFDPNSEVSTLKTLVMKDGKVGFQEV